MRKLQLIAIGCVILAGSGIALGQTVWEQYSGNPIIEPGPPGAWDELGHSINEVVFDGDTYHMWFSPYGSEGRPTDIGHATSTDGIEWTIDPTPVLTRGDVGEWDEEALWTAAVIYDGSLFHMWYDGWDTEFISRVGYATSPDGTVWTKYQGNPVMDAGAPGEWDDYGPQPQTVLFDGDTYKMWYHASHIAASNTTRIGYAESQDGVSWTKHQGPVLEPSDHGWDELWVRFPAVVWDGSTYHMWYSGGREGFNSTDTSSIGYADSSDGLVWTKHEANPVLGGFGDFFYAGQVIVEGRSCRMWYSHYDGEVDWVNLATSDFVDLASYQFIPAAAVASGAEGSFFQTDVDVNNAGDQTITFYFLWLPRGEDNSDPIASETFSLGGEMSVRYDNILSEVFSLEPDALGALAIVSSSPDLLAMSRTCNVPTAKIAGSFGQSIPAIPADEFITAGQRRRILFASEHEDLRTNIGCQSGVDATTIVKIALFDDEGTPLETRQMSLPPLSNKQLNRPFEDYQPVLGYADVWTETEGGSFYCYGSVLDNVTSDPTTVLPQ